MINAGIAVRGGADGVFGSATAAGVMAFQRARGIPVSGKVDAATAAALGLVAAAAPPAAAVAVQLEAKPLQGPCYYGDTWNAARGTGRVHLGVDIGAKEGNAVYAAITGTISQIYTEARLPRRQRPEDPPGRRHLRLLRPPLCTGAGDRRRRARSPPAR